MITEANDSVKMESKTTEVLIGNNINSSSMPETKKSPTGQQQQQQQEQQQQEQHPPTPHRSLSISETADQSYGGWKAPLFLVWFEWPFRVKDPVDSIYLTESTGWAMDSAARGPLNQFGGYVGSAILRLAVVDAGCKSPLNCNKVVRAGLKPSSLLTLSSVVVGIFSAIFMPLAGAIVDHTVYRKHVGVISGILCVALCGIEATISVERNNWLFILVIDGIQTFALNVHNMAVFAYLPDLTSSETVMSHYTSQYFARQFCVQVVYTSLIIIAGVVRGTYKSRSVASSVFTARVAAGVAFGMGVMFMSYAWLYLFRKRPELSKVPDGQTLLNTGFVQVSKTSRKIFKEFSSLKWFMISLLFSPEAGAGVVLSIAVSFFTIEMGTSGQQIAYLTLVVMAATVIGSIFSKFLCRQINPLNTYRSGLVAIAFFIGITVAILDGPDKLNAAYGLTATWGFAVGWTYPAQRVLFCTLIPKGQEAEIMGLFSFCSQIIGWLPPLIVTIMNENGIKLRFGMLVVCIFCMVAFAITLLMGNYETAKGLATRDSEIKLQEVLQATSRVRRDEETKRLSSIQSERKEDDSCHL